MKIKSKYIASIVLSTLVTLQAPVAYAGFFDGLIAAVADGLDTSERNLKTYSTVEDKQLVDAFYYISEDGKDQSVQKDIFAVRKYKFVKLTLDSLTISDFYMKDSMYVIGREMEVYSYNPLDIFGKKYVSFAKSRGNIVKQYKPKLGAVLNNLLEQNHTYKPAPNVSTWIGVDNVLAEYTPNGELVSFMTRSHQAIDQLGATSDQYIHFYFGKALMMFVENKVANLTFENNFQRIIDAIDPSQVAAANSTKSTSASTSTPGQTNVQQESVVSPKQVMKIQLLQQLVDMKKSGALTDEEFAKEKAKILSN